MCDSSLLLSLVLLFLGTARSELSTSTAPELSVTDTGVLQVSNPLGDITFLPAGAADSSSVTAMASAIAELTASMVSLKSDVATLKAAAPPPLAQLTVPVPNGLAAALRLRLGSAAPGDSLTLRLRLSTRCDSAVAVDGVAHVAVSLPVNGAVEAVLLADTAAPLDSLPRLGDALAFEAKLQAVRL